MQKDFRCPYCGKLINISRSDKKILSGVADAPSTIAWVVSGKGKFAIKHYFHRSCYWDYIRAQKQKNDTADKEGESDNADI